MKEVLKVTFVIIGTIIGAGFASGQEIYLFFGKYGSAGLISMLLSCANSGLIIYKTMSFIKKHDINAYQEFLNKLLGGKNRVLVKIIYIIITLFLGISFIVMCAGSGAYFSQELGLPSKIGCFILCGLCILTFRNKTNGIVKVNEIGIPILIILILLLGIANRDGEIWQLRLSNFSVPIGTIINSVLYASFNSIVLIPILIDLKKLAKSKKVVIVIALLCSCILAALGFTILNITWRNRWYRKHRNTTTLCSGTD